MPTEPPALARHVDRERQPHTAARMHGLDAVRGLAIALVFLRHALPDHSGGSGIVGVAIFFTRSGYLITGVLETRYATPGGMAYRRFYRNRFLASTRRCCSCSPSDSL